MNVPPRSTGMASLLARSSAVVPMAPGIAALLVIDTVLRGHPWDHEWGWAIYQAGFVTVFLGPLCAGIGVWDGSQLARAQDSVESAGRATIARAGAWAAIAGAVAAIYLLLLGLLAAVLKAGGIVGWPGIIDLTPVPGVLALCACWTAIGVAVGYRWRTPLLAPILTVAAFGLTLVLYLAQPFLVQVGGATASILFLEPRPSVQISQLVLFGAIAVAAMTGLPIRSTPRPPWRRHAAKGVAPLLAIGALGYLVATPGTAFQDRQRPLRCQGERPEICVADAYRDRVGRPRRYLEPYLDALADVGIAPPSSFSQSPTRPVGTGSIPDELLRGNPPIHGGEGSMGPGGAAVLGAYLPDFCDIYVDASVAAAYNTVSLWLTSLTDPRVLDDPSAPEVLRSGDAAAKGAYLRAALHELETCPT